MEQYVPLLSQYLILRDCQTPMQSQAFKKKYTLQERLAKSAKQMKANPGKIVIIIQKYHKSILPTLSNPRFLCEKEYNFSMIRNLLEKKIKESGKVDLKGTNSFFIFINGTFPAPESNMAEIYERHKDEDGFLYMQYGDQESL